MGFFSDVIGAFTGSTARKAGDIQADAFASAAAEQRQAGEAAQGDLAPFKESGITSLNALMDLLGLNGPEASQNALLNFETSPGFQFRQQEGVNAIDRGASARGLLGSGSRLKALTEFGQNLGSQEFDNRVNRLFALTQGGQNATTTGVNARLGVASNVGNALVGQGTSRASGFVGQANAINDTANSLLKLFGGS